MPSLIFFVVCLLSLWSWALRPMPRRGYLRACYRIVAVETFGRFPAGKTHLGLFVQYGRIGTLLYCRDPLGPNLNKHVTTWASRFAMRALAAVWPALALSFGRVVIPIHGMDDPR